MNQVLSDQLLATFGSLADRSGIIRDMFDSVFTEYSGRSDQALLTGKVEAEENVNWSVSVRRYLVQAACSASRKQRQHFSLRPGGDIAFSS